VLCQILGEKGLWAQVHFGRVNDSVGGRGGWVVGHWGENDKGTKGLRSGEGMGESAGFAYEEVGWDWIGKWRNQT